MKHFLKILCFQGPQNSPLTYFPLAITLSDPVSFWDPHVTSLEH